MSEESIVEALRVVSGHDCCDSLCLSQQMFHHQDIRRALTVIDALRAELAEERDVIKRMRQAAYEARAAVTSRIFEVETIADIDANRRREMNAPEA